jgi:hypothetical protein
MAREGALREYVPQPRDVLFLRGYKHVCRFGNKGSRGRDLSPKLNPRNASAVRPVGATYNSGKTK